MFPHPTYSQGQHLLEKPRAAEDCNWERNVYQAKCPAGVAALSVINKRINMCIHAHVTWQASWNGLLEVR